MKRKAFTLTELMVVMAVVAILVMILIPSVQSVYTTARQTLCQNNLHHIMVAIKIERTDSGRALSMPLPTTSDWPGTSAETVPGSKMYHCPEDVREGVPVDVVPDLIYKSCYPPGSDNMLRFDANSVNPYGHHSTAKRKGRDAEGSYTEYVIEDNPWYEAAFGFSENDGLWRVYDNINDHRELRLLYYTCGGWLGRQNQLYYMGVLKWDNLASHKYPNDKLLLPSAAITSYGLNSCVSGKATVRPQTIVLLDFEDVLAEPNSPTADVKLKSKDSARHRKGHNVLYADGSVKWAGTATLYPALFPDKWAP